MSMKRVFTALLTLCMVLGVLAGPVCAVDIVDSGTCGDNLTWTLDSNGVLTIDGTGSMANYWEDSPWYCYRDQIKGLKICGGVTYIGEYAFGDLSELVSVTIPGNVEAVGMYAFYHCENLQRVSIENGVTFIGSYAFCWCSKLTNVTLPGSVTELGEGLFADCTSLTNISIPEGETILWLNFIRDCENLLCITIPESVTVIKSYAFYGCDNLQHILYAGTQEQWAEIDVDEGNEVLDGVTVHFNTRGDEIEVKKSCSYTTTLCSLCNVSGFVPTGNGHSFENGICAVCGVEDDWEYTVSENGVTFTEYKGEGGDVVIPEQIEGLPVVGMAGSFDFNVEITAISIPGTIDSIRDFEFWGMPLTSVTISEGVTSIGMYAFAGNPTGPFITSHLSSINIPSTITSIGEGGFLGCVNLTDIHFYGDAPDIGTDAFAYVTATAYYPADNDTWTADVMQDYGGTITWVTSSDYMITEGAGASWTKDSDEVLTFHCVAELEGLEAVQVDGAEIASENYMVKSGSTIVTLKADYLQTLETGKHSLTMRFTDGEATVSFVVDEAESEDPTQNEKPNDTDKPTIDPNPETGDADMVTGAVILLCLMGLAVAFIGKRKFI